MKRVRTFSLCLCLPIGLVGVAHSAQLTGRFAGRDVEVVEATVESASQSPVSPRSLPPNGYVGIELLKSNEQDLFEKLSPASRAKLNAGAGEVHEGYCYASSNGSYLAFNLTRHSQFNIVQLSKRPLGDACTLVPEPLEECIGGYCLGQSREDVERQLGMELSRGVASDADLEVAYYQYNVPMSSLELQKFRKFDISEVPVAHNLWFRFDKEHLYYIGVWRNEDLP